MSNYLQSRLHSLACIALLSSQIPAHSQQLSAQKKQEYQAELAKQPWESKQNYSDRLLKNLSVDKLSDNLKESSAEVSGLRDKLIRGIGGLIYDPIHPEQLLDKLITGYDFYLFLHRELIAYGENVLGEQNQIIIDAKRDYKAHIEYLEALKQQKQLIEQRQPHK